MAEEVFLYLPLKVLQEYFVLNNGLRLPKITFAVSHMQEFEKVYNAVDVALEVGYRSFDCSPQYMAEENLGRALVELLPKHNLRRKDIMITSKIHPRDYGVDGTSEAFWRSCERLNTNYIDVFLMQWPGGYNLDWEDDESRYLREDTWKEIVQLSSRGVIRSPGVCHFTSKHLEKLRNCSDRIPTINQVEFHPRHPQVELLGYCEDKNILLQACSFKDTFHPLILRENSIIETAKELKKTPTQIILKWIINKNVGVIPHSENARNIIQNFNLFDFVLEKPEMDLISSIETRQKYLPNPICVD